MRRSYKETKKSLVEDIIVCLNWMRDNNKSFSKLMNINIKSKIDYVIYCSDRLTTSSLMKNRKDVLSIYRDELVELIYNM